MYIHTYKYIEYIGGKDSFYIVISLDLQWNGLKPVFSLDWKKPQDRDQLNYTDTDMQHSRTDLSWRIKDEGWREIIQVEKKQIPGIDHEYLSDNDLISSLNFMYESNSIETCKKLN